MQLLAECFDLFHRGAGKSPREISQLFGRWNKGALGSYLLEISQKILCVEDEETGEPLVQLVEDRAGQKGTGRWTVAAAADAGDFNPNDRCRIGRPHSLQPVGLAAKTGGADPPDPTPP